MTERDYTITEQFKTMNRYFMVPMWRLGLGKILNAWPDKTGRIMVLTNTGRVTGIKHQTPLNYALIDGDVYCLAGFGEKADWYRNILKNPEVEVWLPDGWWAGVAEDATQREDRVEILREVLIASGFAAPLLENLYPREMTAEQLDALLTDYRLVHIQRTEARTGPGGPGELAWIWPVTTFVLLFMWMMRPRKKSKKK